MTQPIVIEIDPKKFADRVPKDILKFLIDALNDAKISISMINHDHEMAIEYRGKQDHFSMGLTSLDDPVSSVIEGIGKLSYILNDCKDTESWTSYRNGKHALHILRNPDVPAAIEEIREAEDNIESAME